MEKLQILVAHERLALGEAMRRVLAAQGFSVEVVWEGEAAAKALHDRSFDAFVLDVALPGGLPCYELITLAKSGVAVSAKVLLVSSVYRRTSYKRRPTQLYGADDYVEIHHLGDQLASKLWRLLGGDVSGPTGIFEAEALLASFQEEGEERLLEPSGRAERLAELIVADMILYAGERLLHANSIAEARVLLARDLEAARQLYRRIDPVPLTPGDDPIDLAFDTMIRDFYVDGREVASL